jgi:hypothetical protein
MSQGALEAALGKLICDDAFREEFYGDAEQATVRAGFHLTVVELSSLRKIAPHVIESFVSHIDDRVRRAGEPVQQPNFLQQNR